MSDDRPTLEVVTVTATAWASPGNRRSRRLHLSVAAHPGCAGPEARPVMTEDVDVVVDRSRPVLIVSALLRMGETLALVRLARLLGGARLCRRCSGEFDPPGE